MKVTLTDIAGYGNPLMAWQCLRDISRQLLEGICLLPDPRNIIIDDDIFMLENNDERQDFTEASAVRELGATVFFLMMGNRVIDSKDQTADTNIPILNPGTYGDVLSAIIRRMLNYNDAERPSVQEVHDISIKEYEAVKASLAQCKAVVRTEGRESITDSFWPEAMRRVTFTLLLFMTLSFSYAQTIIKTTDEMDKLIRCAVDLRQAGKKSQVESRLAGYKFWTLMDEIPVDKKGECKIYDKVDILNINGIGRRIFKKRSGVELNVRGAFCNGADPNFNYSIIEVTAKQGATLSYGITQREGIQTFAIVPVSDKTKYEADISYSKGNRIRSSASNHITLLKTASTVSPSDVITLTIKNLSGANTSFVIINYNSRSK